MDDQRQRDQRNIIEIELDWGYWIIIVVLLLLLGALVGRAVGDTFPQRPPQANSSSSSSSSSRTLNDTGRLRYAYLAGKVLDLYTIQLDNQTLTVVDMQPVKIPAAVVEVTLCGDEYDRMDKFMGNVALLAYTRATPTKQKCRELINVLGRRKGE